MSRAILEDFDLYGQPISLRLLADLRRAVESAQQSVHPTAFGESGDEHLAEYNRIREQAGLPKLGGG